MNEDQRVLDCATAMQMLQEWLDGMPRENDPQLDQHLAECSTCAERFAAGRQLQRAFPPQLSANFADRMVAQVRADRRQRQWKQYFLAAGSLAATILVAVWIAWPMAQRPAEVVAKIAPTPSLDRQVARATTVVRDWTGRAAKSLPRPEFQAKDVLPSTDVAVALIPVTSPLAEAGKGVADGLEPLANSAKRAATRFWRDLPTTD